MIGTMSYNALPHHLMLTKRTYLLPDVAVQRHLLQQLAQLHTEIFKNKRDIYYNLIVSLFCDEVPVDVRIQKTRCQ